MSENESEVEKKVRANVWFWLNDNNWRDIVLCAPTPPLPPKTNANMDSSQALYSSKWAPNGFHRKQNKPIVHIVVEQVYSMPVYSKDFWLISLNKKNRFLYFTTQHLHTD